MENLNATPTIEQPPVIYRKDYTPYAWLIPQTKLDFQLDAAATRVTSTLTIERNPAAEVTNELRLNGDALAAVSVSVDGAGADFRMDGDDLIVTLSGDAHVVEVVTDLVPSANTTLMGLYASGGMLCTQCEAEGFRRITFFPDRPDVLSTYTVRMRGSKAQFPILLCNGNETATGEGTDGTHWAEWHDPWPKPSYLFALVAGDLACNSGQFTTMNGREVELNVWVREEDLPRTDHAVESLRKSMEWDEQTFGREYDLDLYNIVAVSDFNMGAMENKGLNVFNTKYVLADAETATDADFDGVEGVIAHEYFHNWSGNRITCRDWFQLSLKEGFTVLRDQLFSQDMQGEAVKRIEDVRVLRAAQFPEDSGPLAHPIRPDSFREISNFYTATIYNKGAEVIRMMRSMCGVEAFRKGTDLYFDRHDGEAATCEDFICAIEDGAGLDLKQFRNWYLQAGTPKVDAALAHAGGTVTLTLKQTVPDTPGQSGKEPMVIPLRIALLDRETGAHRGEELVVLTQAEQSFTFTGYSSEPALSINRGFTAPVVLERAVSSQDLLLLAAHDDDPFARAEAMQELVVAHLVAAAKGGLSGAEQASGEAAIVQAFGAILSDTALDDSMRGELMVLPSHTYLFEQIVLSGALADPGAIHSVREGLKQIIAASLSQELDTLYARCSAISFADPEGRGARKVKAMALGLIAASDASKAAGLARAQYDAASNMTDRQSALMTLCSIDGAAREAALADFHARFADNDLVVDKWFTLQALSLHPEVLSHVKALADHADFTIHNPNRVRSLYMALAGNPFAFHDASGEGYRMVADLVIALDPINPQTAARFIPALGKWRKIEVARAGLMRAELERIAQADGLSRDTMEQVTRSLEG